MDNTYVLISVPPEELKKLIINAIEEVNSKKIPPVRKPFTKKQAIEFLSTSPSSFNRLCKQGKLKKFTIGKLVYVEAASVYKLVNHL